MQHCDDCFAGVTHEGTPTGTLEQIGGVDRYVATPAGDYPKNKVILLLTDVFGIPLVNNKTIIPDLFFGDPIPAHAMEPAHLFDRDGWVAAHGPAQTRPPLDKVTAALKETGVTDFGASGYCFGARYVFDLAFDGIISVSVISHPSRLAFPEDFEKYANDVKAPLLINSCEIDQGLPLEIHDKVDQVFSKFESGYKREYFEGCKHGFAVRGDLSDPKVKAGKEGSFRAAAKWFLEYL
ncbi:uncharacterized protein EV420DRAFT_1764770 [Desarmillaria tabescens]|uniref:Dienelactone hydrolase domain-containing protein n=1 Tax=Armillaria tabescens TaxID=1929756 RepID=A0AA39N4R1_ARMTA|nr:uncharacterized protein EV420DRAFT_1764770 [Desarmillaria tabescens]KAK0457847.1 hypothetical protein EV420DRAFT_1764770 [Desarmillaria tabescens]